MHSSSKLSESTRLPLCLRYAAVQFSSICGHVAQGDRDLDCPLIWGLAMQYDEHADLIGVWSGEACRGLGIEAIAGSLVARGLESIGVLVNGASEELSASLLRAFPSAAAAPALRRTAQRVTSVAPVSLRETFARDLAKIHSAATEHQAHAMLDALAASTWQGAPAVVQICRAAIRQWQAIYALPKRARERVRRGEDAAWLLQQGVSRALARHGAFESAEAAAAFAEAWLFDAERRARRQRLAAAHRADLAAAPASA